MLHRKYKQFSHSLSDPHCLSTSWVSPPCNDAKELFLHCVLCHEYFFPVREILLDKQAEKCFASKNLSHAFIVSTGRGILKSIYCSTITRSALKLIRSFDGDVVDGEALICNFTHEEPSKDRNGRMIEDAFKIYFPNGQAICYALSGEISFVL